MQTGLQETKAGRKGSSKRVVEIVQVKVQGSGSGTEENKNKQMMIERDKKRGHTQIAP